MKRPRLVRLPGPRVRRRVLLASKILIVTAAILTILAVNVSTPLTLSTFLLVGQTATLLGAAFALFVAATDFLRSRGTSEVHFEAGETIFRQGDQGDLFYVIVRGEVEVLRREDDGPQKLIATMGEGEYFGEMALLGDAPRNATLRARTQVDAVAIARTDFTTLYAHLPNLRHVEKMMKERVASPQPRGSKKLAGLLLASNLLWGAPATAAAEDAVRGEKLYAKHACSQCHGARGAGDGMLLTMLKEKPPMRDWTQEGSLDDLSDTYLVEIIEKGGEKIGKSKIMLAYGHKLSTQELQDLVAFVRGSR